MLPFLALLPVGTSLILGIVYVIHADGPPAIKFVGIDAATGPTRSG